MPGAALEVVLNGGAVVLVACVDGATYTRRF